VAEALCNAAGRHHSEAQHVLHDPPWARLHAHGRREQPREAAFEPFRRVCAKLVETTFDVVREQNQILTEHVCSSAEDREIVGLLGQRGLDFGSPRRGAGDLVQRVHGRQSGLARVAEIRDAPFGTMGFIHLTLGHTAARGERDQDIQPRVPAQGNKGFDGVVHGLKPVAERGQVWTEHHDQATRFKVLEVQPRVRKETSSRSGRSRRALSRKTVSKCEWRGASTSSSTGTGCLVSQRTPRAEGTRSVCRNTSVGIRPRVATAPKRQQSTRKDQWRLSQLDKRDHDIPEATGPRHMKAEIKAEGNRSRGRKKFRLKAGRTAA
jgi:hypothetical protein